jgi:hypothetical protein
VSFEAFERHLLTQKQPEWNRAVGFVADEIREVVEEARAPSYEVPSLARQYLFPGSEADDEAGNHT